MIKKSWIAVFICFFCLFLCGSSFAEENEDVFLLPETKDDFAYRLSDSDRNSRIGFDGGEECTVLTKGYDSVLIEWYSLPSEVHVSQFDETGEKLSDDICSGSYENLISCDNRCSKLCISSDSLFSICEISLLSSEQSDEYIPLKNPDKVDLLFVFAHSGDETLYTPGIVAKYSMEYGVDTCAVFMSYKNRQQIKETLDAMRLYGSDYQPVFLNYRYSFLEPKFGRYKAKFWDKKQTLADVVSCIRFFRPKVVVTNASAGEDDDMMRAFLTEIVSGAAEKASSSVSFSGIFPADEPWSIEKLYFHEITDTDDASETDISVSISDPIFHDTDISYKDVSSRALEGYHSLGVFHYSLTSEPVRFSLQKSSVGTDSDRNSLFENISFVSEGNTEKILRTLNVIEPQNDSSNVLSDDSTETDSVLPEDESVVDTDSQSQIIPNEEIQVNDLPDEKIMLASFGVFLILGIIVSLIFRKKKGILWIGISVIAVSVSGFIFYLCFHTFAKNEIDNHNDEIHYVESKNDDLKSQEFIMKDEEEIASEPVQNDLIPDDSTDKFFLSDGTEEIVFDDENGHWEYKSGILAINIHKNSVKNAGGDPVVYYVAQIRMNGVDSYRSGFGYFNEAGSAKAKPYEIARKYKAVLAITGDNLVNAETKNKGVLIRDGKLYSEGKHKEETMALNSDLSISIYPKETDFSIVVEDGVQNSYGFGPTLVRNGECEPELERHRLNRVNPRCGIGMVEPGYYIAIVVDGRQPGYSVGLSLVDFARLFQENGCSVAFNMDGGVSAGMVFMGEHINRHRSSRTGKVSSQRPWPDALMFGYSELVPSVDDAIINTGNGNEADFNRRKLKEASEEQNYGD